MGLRAQNNPKASFEDPYSGTGTKAWKPYSAPEGLGASGGVINDYESGGKYYRTHMFQTSGSFVVNNLATDAALPDKVDILLVGGGGGGAADAGGGGGGGGVQVYSDDPTWNNTGSAYDVTAQTYPITIGSGGAGTRTSAQWNKPFRPSWNDGYTTKSAGRGGYAYPGQNSVFSTPTGAVYTAGYGGGGGSNNNWPTGAAAQAGGPGGGSGGGAGGGPGNPHSGGSAGPGGGYQGGSSPETEYGGGGGGAGATGGRTPHPWYANQASSPGGNGKQCVILGPQLADPIAYWGGGGAGCRGPGPGSSPSPDGTGGTGGGGAGGGKNNTWPTSGLGGGGYNYGGEGWPVSVAGPNPHWDTGDRSFDLGGGRWTGGGGGGTGGPQNETYPNGRRQFIGTRGGNGGEGTCVIRYEISNLQYHGVKATGGYTSQYNNKTIHVFNRSGTFTNVSGAPLDCEVVTIAGGGGGGLEQGGGGGAGGMLITPTITVDPAAPNAVTVTIGVGGVAQRWEPKVQVHPNWSAQNGNDDAGMAQRGGNSSFGPTLVAIGGGGGGQAGNNSGTDPTSSMGQPGGSGGGLGAAPGTPTDPAPTNPQIVGWNDPTAPGQGYPGGLGINPSGGGGGGGGAGGAGSNWNPPPSSPSNTNADIGGTGGIGKKLPATFQDPQMAWGAPGPGPGRWFCGGGGGGNSSVHPGQQPAIKNPSGGGGPRGDGGATPWSGGGNGGGNNADSGISGASGWENTGGGGGGGAATSKAWFGGKGGPGIVFVAYDNPAPAYN